MNYTYHRKTILLSRNEGKLKSYDSCFDLRAWSHDMSARDRYLREWMKCNMPPCLLPLSTLNNLLKSMSCRNIGQVSTALPFVGVHSIPSLFFSFSIYNHL